MENSIKIFKVAGLIYLTLVAGGVLTAPKAMAVSGGVITVTATVAETISCGNSSVSTSFGTLSASSITTSGPVATTTLSCNSAAGCTLSVNDLGHSSTPGLYNSAGSGNVIVSSTTALSAGTEGYGIQAATSSAGSAATLTVNSTYLKTGNNVGGLTIAGTMLASSLSPTSGREVVVNHLAAISALTPSGSYSDTITYSCLGN